MLTGSNATLTIGESTFKLKEWSMVALPVYRIGGPFLSGMILDWASAGPRPPKGRVWVDGLERASIKRCHLGPFGWAEQAVRTPDGKLIRENGRIKTRIVRGIVVFKPFE